MVPRTLSDWTLEAVTALLKSGTSEGDTFDFKEMLPDRRNVQDKDRLRKTCAAFANTLGGFFVFGIKDDRTLSPDDRLVGIDSSYELPRDFGNFPAGCNPSVGWTFSPTPLPLTSGKVLHVIHVPKSWKSPHAVGTAEEGWSFPKRTNKGNEGMSVEEVRSAFTFQAEAQKRLVALFRQLLFNLDAWKVQREHVTSTPVRVHLLGSMTRAIEDYITNPVFEHEISLVDVGLIWQHARIIDRVVNTLSAPLQNEQSKTQGADAMVREIDLARPLCEKVAKQVQQIIRRLA